jgi:hypothetical protein
MTFLFINIQRYLNIAQKHFLQKVLFFAKMTLSSLYKNFWSSKNYQACILNFTLPHFRKGQREANGFLTN